MKSLKAFLVFLCIFVFTASANGEDYVIAVVYGSGLNKSNYEKYKDSLPFNPEFKGGNYTRFNLLHSSKQREWEKVLTPFQCRNGKQGNQKKLTIVAMSWGATAGHKLAQLYNEKCGKISSHFYMLDGVAKPIGAFAKTPLTNNCINLYQRRSLIKGRALKGCKNFNLTQQCVDNKSSDCHNDTLDAGVDYAGDHFSQILGS